MNSTTHSKKWTWRQVNERRGAATGILILLFLLTLPAVVQAQFHYTTNYGAITITEYTGPGGAVTIPDTINGYPVTTIGPNAFAWWQSLTSVTIPSSVTYIMDSAFSYCLNLMSVYCLEHTPPFIGNGVFFYVEMSSDRHHLILVPDRATVYYLPGSTGWPSIIGAYRASSDFYPSFAGLPTALWNPQVASRRASFGVRSNQFGFDITGTPDIPLAVEASTNPTMGGWTTLQTCILTNGSIYFSDPQWTNYPARLYRIRAP